MNIKNIIYACEKRIKYLDSCYKKTVVYHQSRFYKCYSKYVCYKKVFIIINLLEIDIKNLHM